MHFLVEARHPPDLCPMANATTRALGKAAAAELPALAEKLGVTVTGTYVPGPNHLIVIVVEADDIKQVGQLVHEGRLAQWNTCEIYPTKTLQEAMDRADELPAIF
jgi:hypothetical protein